MLARNCWFDPRPNPYLIYWEDIELATILFMNEKFSNKWPDNFKEGAD